MKTAFAAALAALLVCALGACTVSPSPSPADLPAPLRKVPVILASFNKGADSAAFAVAEMGPSGTVPHENLEGGVWVLFTQPVVPLKTLAAPATGSDVISITPKVDGVYRWYGSRLLAFEPKAQLAPSTEYTVTVSASLRSLAGDPISGDRRFTFRTEPLDIVTMSPSGSDVAPEAANEVIVTFNFP
ncbi:MAG TPA: Ig-like domain-containing protein, partial [Spirochaetia bacterium]